MKRPCSVPHELTRVPAPLVPGRIKAPNTNFYRALEHGDDHEAFGRWAADEIGPAIEREGPYTVAA